MPLSKIRPVDQSNKQKYLAHLLAAGISVQEAADMAGLRPRHVEIMMQGSLFALEVDRARTELMREKIAEFEKASSDELQNCLLVAKQIRDDEQLHPKIRLDANKQIMEHILAKSVKLATENTMKATLTISNEKRERINNALKEITPVITLEPESTISNEG